MQPDSSSVDTELEVSINNAHLLTNLAKAVQENAKERNDLKIQQSIQLSNEKNHVQLQEDLWLFAYEEQAEQACAEHDTEGKQRDQRDSMREEKNYLSQGNMLDNLIRDTTNLA